MHVVSFHQKVLVTVKFDLFIVYNLTQMFYV